MDSAAHKRIDEGVKRGPHQHLTAPSGKLHPSRQYPLEVKQHAINDAQSALLAGETTLSIAKRHSVTVHALRFWIMQDPSTSQLLRDLVDSEMIACLGDLEDARQPIQLAGARERFRAWSWLAERRDAVRYGAKVDVQHTFTGPVIAINVSVSPIPGLTLEHQAIDSKDDSKA